jgi:hypothetical protein
MKQVFLVLSILFLVNNVNAQHHKVQRIFHLEKEKHQDEVFNFPQIFNYQTRSFCVTTKGSSYYIDTLYSIRYNTDFYDVHDYDSSYFVTGIVYHQAHSTYEPHNPTLIVTLKLDYYGNIEWYRIDSSMWGNHFIMNRSLIKTSDDNYVLAASVFNDFGNPKKYEWRAAHYIKFDKNGNTIWQKLYKDTAYHHSGDWPMDIIAEDDGGFTCSALLGSVSKTYSTDTLIDFWYIDTAYVGMIRYDSSGNILYRKKYNIGGNGVGVSLGSLMKVNDGGYIIGGNQKFNKPDHLRDYFIIKVDSLFNWQWMKKFSQTAAPEARINLIPISDDGFMFSVCRSDTPVQIVGGFTYYEGYYHIGFMDSAFNLLKDTMFNIYPNPPNLYYYDPGMLVGSCLQQNKTITLASNVGVGADLVQLDSNFNINWIRLIADFPYFTEVAYKMRPAKEGGYLIVGQTKRDGLGGWFVKTDTNGYALPNCADTLYHIGISDDPQKPSLSVKVYPNPVKEFLMLEFENDMNTEIQVVAYDMMGKEMYNKNFSSLQDLKINMIGWKPGMYLMKIGTSYSEQFHRVIKI